MNNLHVGSGRVRIPGFINIDIEPSFEPDVCADVLTLNYSDIETIYSCHFLEHLSVYDSEKCLNLFFNWLRPEGILRLAVPDLELAAKSYATGSDMKFIYGAYFKGYYLHDTPCERFNYFMKEWEHKIIYDFNQLHLMLSNAGFKTIERKQPNESLIPDFNYDRFISESLYVEAIK